MINFNVNSHYYVPVTAIFGVNFDDEYTNRVRYVECVLAPYEFDGFNYKLYCIPLDNRFSKKEFYVDDFESFLDKEIIKNCLDCNVVDVEVNEPIFNNIYIVHKFEALM